MCERGKLCLSVTHVCQGKQSVYSVLSLYIISKGTSTSV